MIVDTQYEDCKLNLVNAAAQLAGLRDRNVLYIGHSEREDEKPGRIAELEQEVSYWSSLRTDLERQLCQSA
jgi:hypothetical protein